MGVLCYRLHKAYPWRTAAVQSGSVVGGGTTGMSGGGGKNDGSTVEVGAGAAQMMKGSVWFESPRMCGYVHTFVCTWMCVHCACMVIHIF